MAAEHWWHKALGYSTRRWSYRDIRCAQVMGDLRMCGSRLAWLRVNGVLRKTANAAEILRCTPVSR